MRRTTESKLSNLAEGDRCFGRFVLDRELGRSGIGAVWLARDQTGARNVALKFLTERLALNSLARSELKREVERGKALRAATFAQLYELIEDAGSVAVSSEFVPGTSFAAFRSEAGGASAMEAPELASWLEELGRAFAEAHGAGLVHGALHPGHLVVTADRQIKVLDFGIARTLIAAAARQDRNFFERAPSHVYASPQIRAGVAPTPRDDVYAFGAILRELPGPGAPSLSSIAAARWQEMIEACLADNPEQRPATISAAVERLGWGTSRRSEDANKTPAPKNGSAVASASIEENPLLSGRGRAVLFESADAEGPRAVVAASASTDRPRSPRAGATATAPVVTTLPEVNEARAVAAQRSHHKGALIALACLAVGWFGLRIFSERVLPPAVPANQSGVATTAPVSASLPGVETPGDDAEAPSSPAPPAEIEAPSAEPARMLADAREDPLAAPPATEPLPADPTSPTEPSLSGVNPPASSTPPPPLASASPAAPAPPPAVATAPIPPPAPTEPIVTAPSVAATPPPLATAVPAAAEVIAPAATAAIAPPPTPETPAPTAIPAPRRAEPVPSSRPPKVGQRWTNSLGMPLAPVPKLPLLIAIWETRVRDFEAFVKATGAPRNDGITKPPDDHPVTGVSFLEATLFCEWLTTTETAARRLKGGQHYRLPTDAEWSAAAGIPDEVGTTLRERDDQSDRTFAWGTQWPRPPGAGNFSGVHAPEAIAGADIYERSAPVGTFAPNRLGLFDLGGNAAEMVSDLIAPELGLHATRGASFADADERTLRLRARGVGENSRGTAPHLGFRVVLDLSGTN